MIFRPSDKRYLNRLIFAGCMLLLSSATSSFADTNAPRDVPAGTAQAAQGEGSPATTYKSVELKELVAGARTELPGQRIIFAPTAIRFRAVLAAMPVPQKTDYLKQALGMMGISNLGNINQRIGLGYGGDKALAAYIDDTAASRLTQGAKPGQSLQFYAYHVYNHSRGPALVITSFSQ